MDASAGVKRISPPPEPLEGSENPKWEWQVFIGKQVGELVPEQRWSDEELKERGFTSWKECWIEMFCSNY